MNILIVGGAGYIGSHTAKILHQKGYSIIIYDNLSKGHKEAVTAISPAIPLEIGDLGDAKRLTEVFTQYKIDVVMHFAAFIEVATSVIDPASYYNNNVIKVITLLDTMRKNNIKYFVFSSTAAVFGDPQAQTISEEHPQLPINPYGQSKLMVEKILMDYEKAYGFHSTILRYFNACGADDSGKIGQSYTPPTHLMSILLETALAIRPKITVFGTDYPTRDGSCIRDFIHVNDLAQAHILGLERMIEQNTSDHFNLGNGSGFSVKEVIDKTKEITKIDFPVEYGERRAGDPPLLIANSEKAQKVLNWQPKYSLEDMITTAWNWERNKTF